MAADAVAGYNIYIYIYIYPFLCSVMKDSNYLSPLSIQKLWKVYMHLYMPTKHVTMLSTNDAIEYM